MLHNTHVFGLSEFGARGLLHAGATGVGRPYEH